MNDETLGRLVLVVSTVLTFAILARSLMSWFPVAPGNPMAEFLFFITEPILAPFRRIIPRPGMIDLSPLVAILVLQVLGNFAAQGGDGAIIAGLVVLGLIVISILTNAGSRRFHVRRSGPRPVKLKPATDGRRQQAVKWRWELNKELDVVQRWTHEGYQVARWRERLEELRQEVDRWEQKGGPSPAVEEFVMALRVRRDSAQRKRAQIDLALAKVPAPVRSGDPVSPERQRLEALRKQIDRWEREGGPEPEIDLSPAQGR
jgi:YggT family protein